MSEPRAHELVQAEVDQFQQNLQEQKTVNYMYVKPEKSHTHKLKQHNT